MKFELSQPEVIRHLTLLGIGLLLLSVMVGLFQTFDLLETSSDPNQTSVIFEGLKTSSITFIVGVIVVGSSFAAISSHKKRER